MFGLYRKVIDPEMQCFVKKKLRDRHIIPEKIIVNFNLT